MTRLDEATLGATLVAGILYAVLSPSHPEGASCRVPRMSYEQSSAIKRSMLPPGGRMADYELDHIMPLCLCGTNDRSNLQLQPWDEARAKDVVEVRLCKAVQRGEMPMARAQEIMRTWK